MNLCSISHVCVAQRGTREWALCPALGNELSEETHVLTGDTCAVQSRDFIGKGNACGVQQGKGTQEDCSATWLTVSGLRVWD